MDVPSLSPYRITGKTVVQNGVRCAELKVANDSRTYLAAWSNFSFLRKHGEKNISAKLTASQVKQIVKEAYLKPHSEVTFKSLAEKYNVSSSTIADIANGRSWRTVTATLIERLKNGEPIDGATCISASNDMKRKSTKLNPSMAKFIVRDHFVNNVPVKSLAKKFLMSERAIRRVITGVAWKAVTVPAIAEYSNWKS